MSRRRVPRLLTNGAVQVSLIVIAVVGFVVVSVAKTTYYKPGRIERSEVGRAGFASGFTVAVVWPDRSEADFVNGVEFAVEELNAAHAPLSNKIHLKFVPETNANATQVARDVVADPRVVVAIGHEISPIAASITYQNHGVLFVAPKSTNPHLTTHDFDYVFRLTPTDEELADAITRFALERGWTRVGVLVGRNDHGDTALRQFQIQAAEQGLEVVFAQSYAEEPDWSVQDFRPMIAAIRKQKFDAILFADVLPWAGKVLKDMQEMGLTEPIIATDKLDEKSLWTIAGTAANGLYVTSAVDPNSQLGQYVGFRARFHKRFGEDPDYGAAQGYEALMLIANAATLSKSADPLVLSTTLRTNKWNGLFGPFSFDHNGDVLDRRLTLKRMQDGVFYTEDSVVGQKDVTDPMTEEEEMSPAEPARK